VGGSWRRELLGPGGAAGSATGAAPARGPLGSWVPAKQPGLAPRRSPARPARAGAEACNVAAGQVSEKRGLLVRVQARVLGYGGGSKEKTRKRLGRGNLWW
jgi:hypothetical protein